MTIPPIRPNPKLDNYIEQSGPAQSLVLLACAIWGIAAIVIALIWR